MDHIFCEGSTFAVVCILHSRESSSSFATMQRKCTYCLHSVLYEHVRIEDFTYPGDILQIPCHAYIKRTNNITINFMESDDLYQGNKMQSI
mmetsp:Transcript_3152/g.4817  ORF Transcript_3152/g.4817 Transcript_3152/m.4817 type:complete len:91 (+) Transcript_3152:543-815(+)